MGSIYTSAEEVYSGIVYIPSLNVYSIFTPSASVGLSLRKEALGEEKSAIVLILSLASLL